LATENVKLKDTMGKLAHINKDLRKEHLGRKKTMANAISNPEDFDRIKADVLKYATGGDSLISVAKKVGLTKTVVEKYFYDVFKDGRSAYRDRKNEEKRIRNQVNKAARKVAEKDNEIKE